MAKSPEFSVFVISGILNENVKYCRKEACYQTMQENRKLRVAAIGVGSLGRHHARNYTQLAREDRVDLVGVCDTNPLTAAEVSSSASGSTFSDWRELLGAVDAVSIATPTETHA